MPGAPLVTILMPVRNGLPWLKEALGSLAAQTLREIEILVLEDGSTDATPDVLAGWPDTRLRTIRTHGIGIGGALNVGLRAARAPFIARQDADDRSHPARLERQLAFLQAHPDIDLVGCAAEYIDAGGRPVDNAWVRTIRAQQDPAVRPEQIRALMPLTCCLTHGSIVARAALLRRAGGYTPEASPAEDYELWLRLLPEARFARLPERLYTYRVHGSQATAAARAHQMKTTIGAKLRYLRRLCPELPVPARLAIAGSRRGAAHYEASAHEHGFVPIAAPRALEPEHLPFLSRTLLRRGAFESWDALVVTDFAALDGYTAIASIAAPGLLRIGNFFVKAGNVQACGGGACASSARAEAA